MAIPLSDNVQINSNKPQDAKYGPYATPSAAKAAIVLAYRYKGLTVGVTQVDGSIQEYWWKGGTADADLTVKSSAGGATTTDIKVTGTQAGNLGEGSVIPAGSDLDHFIRQLLVRRVGPSYNSPSGAVSTTPSQTVYEMGTRLSSITVNVSYNRNDAGPMSSLSVRQNGTQIGIVSGTQATNVVLSATPIVFDALINYEAGSPKSDNMGTADLASPIGAGNIDTNDISYRGIFPWFYGSSNTRSITGAMIYAGAKVVEQAGNQINIPSFGTGNGVDASGQPNPAFLWFAVPTGTKVYGSWYRTALDNGAIGGASDLFPGKSVVNVTSAGRAAGTQEYTQSYDLYVSGYQTAPGVSTTIG